MNGGDTGVGLDAGALVEGAPVPLALEAGAGTPETKPDVAATLVPLLGAEAVALDTVVKTVATISTAVFVVVRVVVVSAKALSVVTVASSV